jgi:hypothetical protein
VQNESASLKGRVPIQTPNINAPKTESSQVRGVMHLEMMDLLGRFDSSDAFESVSEPEISFSVSSV